MERKAAERLLRDFAAAAHDVKSVGELELGTPDGQLEEAIRKLRYRRLRRRILDELTMIESLAVMSLEHLERAMKNMGISQLGRPDDPHRWSLTDFITDIKDVKVVLSTPIRDKKQILGSLTGHDLENEDD